MGKGGRAIKNALEESRSATPAKESTIAAVVELLQKAFDRMMQDPCACITGDIGKRLLSTANER